jgi:hypothetical protein
VHQRDAGGVEGGKGHGMHELRRHQQQRPGCRVGHGDEAQQSQPQLPVHRAQLRREAPCHHAARLSAASF